MTKLYLPQIKSHNLHAVFALIGVNVWILDAIMRNEYDHGRMRLILDRYICQASGSILLCNSVHKINAHG